MLQDYVEQRDGGYYVRGSRVSLDSIVHSFRSGESPETIQQNFPSLTLEQVYGAVAFYLGRQPEVDRSIRDGEAALRGSVPSLAERKPEAYERLQRARQTLSGRR